MHYITNALLMLRCCIAFYTFLFASIMLRLAILAMPCDHPGRTYVAGRREEGHERIREAMSERAATSYITSRRR